MADAPPWRAAEGGVRIRVRLTPKGGRDRIEGVTETAAGRALKARVASPPAEGAANAALVALLADALGVPKTAVRIEAGITARIKTVLVEGDRQALAVRLDALAAGAV